MQIKTKSGRLITIPTPKEDAQITAAVLTDADDFLWTDEQLAGLKLKRPRGRPFGSGVKEQVTLRLVPESFFCAYLTAQSNNTGII